MRLRRQQLRDRVTITSVTDGPDGVIEGAPVEVWANVSTERALARDDDQEIVTDSTVISLHPQTEMISGGYVEAAVLAVEGSRIAFAGQESVVTRVTPESMRGRLVRVDLVAQ